MRWTFSLSEINKIIIGSIFTLRYFFSVSSYHVHYLIICKSGRSAQIHRLLCRWNINMSKPQHDSQQTFCHIILKTTKSPASHTDLLQVDKSHGGRIIMGIKESELRNLESHPLWWVHQEGKSEFRTSGNGSFYCDPIVVPFCPQFRECCTFWYE